MTSELGPSARALLDAARSSSGPDAAAIARMRAKIDAAVAAPAATAATSSLARGTRETVTGSLAGKLVALALVVATGAVLLATRNRAEVQVAGGEITTPAPSPRTVREAPPVAAPAMLEPREPAMLAREPAMLPSIDPAAIELETPQRRPPAVPAKSATRTVELAREVELVDRAMTALRRGELRSALAAVRLHATETANRGQLAEDASAIEIEALCTLRDPGAQARLAAFDVRWPTSAQRARLTAACK